MKITFRIDGSGIDEGLAEFRQLLQEELTYRLDAVGWQIVADAIELAPHGFGYLRSTISHKVITTALSVELVVGAAAIYAAAVEYGSRPHWPPWSKGNPDAEPLRRWAERYLGDADLAYVLARKIAREGTPAQPFLEPALEMNYPLIADTIDDAVRSVMERLFS